MLKRRFLDNEVFETVDKNREYKTEAYEALQDYVEKTKKIKDLYKKYRKGTLLYVQDGREEELKFSYADSYHEWNEDDFFWCQIFITSREGIRVKHINHRMEYSPHEALTNINILEHMLFVEEYSSLRVDLYSCIMDLDILEKFLLSLKFIPDKTYKDPKVVKQWWEFWNG
ncbi:hypothetical protein [Cognatishimia sp.]|uniref:hypothetical protein n=1 Tax=Cognatishimia sp. TaxID=2211648 RepID=UPI0035110125|nr:hypothetical protein [Cognatishimia sp.]